jgi:hypothetical protein
MRCADAWVRMGARNMRACEGYMAPPSTINLSRALTTGHGGGRKGGQK